jgi:exopolyphosphatase / guanosine-5'-triphosphate,3'-diphosphate pyrophosphatase
MRCAVLDLGSNSFHLLVADVEASTVMPVRREREMLHLGRALARHGRIPVDLEVRAVATVERLADLARRSGAQHVVAVGTEALRGPERAALVERLTEAAGTPIAILDGTEEARLSYLGARASIDVEEEPTLVIDLGGGSLELAIGTGDRILWASSLPLGASRLTAMVDPIDPDDTDEPVTPEQLEALRAHIDGELDAVTSTVSSHAPRTVLAVGGTVRALARMLAVRADRWLPATVNQAPLTLAELTPAVVDLTAVGTAGRARIPGVKSRRADHLHVAALVLESALHRIDGGAARVSDWGLREGVLLHRFGDVRAPSGTTLRDQQVSWLQRTFSPDDEHPSHVAASAVRLFDASTDLHGHGDDARTLLEHAARLHAIGSALALRRQQEHGAYLIEHAELRGFDPEELAVVLTLVRFHPSRGISRRFPAFASLSADDREMTTDLLALLQVADALDAGHDQHTAITAVRRSRGAFEVELAAPASPLTERAVRDRSSLFNERFALPITLSARAAA